MRALAGAPTRSARSSARDPQAWTVSDLPLLDAARLRLGDPEASRRRRRLEAAAAAERERMATVVDHLIATDDSEMQVMSMLRGSDAQSILIDEDALPAADPDLLAGPFAHIVVDEAQELTDAEWQMLLLAARPEASPSSGIARRPGTGSPSHGRSGWSGSGSPTSNWLR